MERKYKVKLLEGHTAKPDQIVNGYLGTNGKVILYSQGDARKKAGMFGGKTEPHSPSFFIADIRVAQIDRNNLVHGVEDFLNVRGKAFGKAGDSDCLYYASIVDELLEAPPSLLGATQKQLSQLHELSEYLTNYDYIMLIS